MDTIGALIIIKAEVIMMSLKQSFFSFADTAAVNTFFFALIACE
jgi:hypothetical protein